MPHSLAFPCNHPHCGNRKPCPLHRARIFIVCGAPGSGKSTYVKNNMMPGDLVFDHDLIMAAITGMPIYQSSPAAFDFVLKMRDGFMEAALSDPDVGGIWIITSTPSDDEREYLERHLSAKMVILDTPESVCIQRTAERGTHWKNIIEKWFASRRLQSVNA